MSTAENDNSRATVVDDENTVDQKVKNRILETRKRVDEREDGLFVRAVEDPNVDNLNPSSQLNAWGTSVRQFLRTIRPLLTSDAMPNSNHYWEEVEIVERMYIPPPDGKYPWSKISHVDDEQRLKKQHGLPFNFQWPQPKPVEFNGLKSILEQKQISITWDISIGQRANRETDRVSVQSAIPKEILESGIECADEFLHQAGIGVNIEKEPYYAEGEPGL